MLPSLSGCQLAYHTRSHTVSAAENITGPTNKNKHIKQTKTKQTTELILIS